MHPVQSPGTVEGEWPWSCTNCGTTIYHDGYSCRECSRRLAADGGPGHFRIEPSSGSIADWMRRHSYAGFLAKVARIAAVEVLVAALVVASLVGGTVPTIPGLPF